ncbi:YkvR family protein [Bacillus subtilis]|nr:YkvR family protein [Bacillus subtilis]MCW0119202.1 YkvR family protein [Bacillus subtilis]
MKTLRLNNVTLEMATYQEESEPKRKIAFTLNVTSETYHDIAVLLYEKTFNVEVPERDLAFRGGNDKLFNIIDQPVRTRGRQRVLYRNNGNRQKRRFMIGVFYVKKLPAGSF